MKTTITAIFLALLLTGCVSTPTPVASSSPSPAVSASSQPSASPSPSQAPVPSASPSPSLSPSPSPSPSITVSPSPSPVASPSQSPSPLPSSSSSVLSFPPAAVLISPAAGSVLTGATQTFVFSTPGAINCSVSIGPTQGSPTYGWFENVPCGSVTGTNLPVNGSVVWIRIFAQNAQGDGYGVDFQFVAATTSLPSPSPSPSIAPSPSPKPSPSATPSGSPSPSPSASSSVLPLPPAATLISPPNHSTLTGGNSQTFVFSDPQAFNCSVAVGLTEGDGSLDYFTNVPCTSVTVSNLPVGTMPIWIRIFPQNAQGKSSGNDFSFTASLPTPLPSPSSTGACNTIGIVTGMPYCNYAPSSVWNQPLPTSSPSINPSSQAMMNNLFLNYTYNGAFSVDPPGSPGAFPAYVTHSGDPIVNVTPQYTYGSLSGAIPMPTNAVPGPPTDAHLQILNPANGNDYEIYMDDENASAVPQNTAIVPGAKITIGVGSILNYRTGTGWGGVTTAAGAGLLGGLVTVDEFLSGTIHHALAIAPACNNGAGSVYPATSVAAYYCPAVGATGPGIPHGSRIWSDLTPTQVKALGFDKISSMLLIALNQYGAFVTDTNGWIAFDIRNIMEQPVTSAGATYWAQNGGLSPALNKQPASFFTTHLHVLQVCVTQGGC
jgi:hypothetical protein